QRRAQDEDAGLAQGLAEETEDPSVEDVAGGLAAELDYLTEAGGPVPWNIEPAASSGATGADARNGAGVLLRVHVSPEMATQGSAANAPRRDGRGQQAVSLTVQSGDREFPGRSRVRSRLPASG